MESGLLVYYNKCFDSKSSTSGIIKTLGYETLSARRRTARLKLFNQYHPNLQLPGNSESHDPT